MSGDSGAGDPRFFARTGPHSLAAIARVAEGETSAGAAERLLTGVAPLQLAEPHEVSFLDNRRYADALAGTRAGAVIVHPDMVGRVPQATVAIVTTEPYVGWARVAALFHPEPPVAPGRHPSAVIDPSAQIDPTVEIGPLVVIGPAAEIGPRCRIDAGAMIGGGVRLGMDCRIGSNATVSHALLGDRVILSSGARVGQEGFGFATTKQGFLSVPQLGRVILEHDVELGANTTVDRGSVQDTVIGAGSRLDNLVQIGHNVRVGRACVIVSQAGISGSTILEDFVMIGGQAGLTGHLRIGRGARLGAQAGVMSDVPAGQEYAGAPAMPVRAFFRTIATLRRLVEEAQADRKQAGRARTHEGRPAGGQVSAGHDEGTKG